MRFHVLGLGSIGTLISHHIRRHIRLRQAGELSPKHFAGLSPQTIASLTPSPAEDSITLHTRSLRNAQRYPRTAVEHAGVKTEEEGYRFEVAGRDLSELGSPSDGKTLRTSGLAGSSSANWPVLGSSVAAQAGYGDASAIDSLIVTTKADATVDAMLPLSHRLTPASTVVFLQNGLGIVEKVVDQIFPDPASRPHLVLGNLTHGCWSRKPYNIVHAGFGSMYLGVLPDATGRADYEQTQRIRNGDDEAPRIGDASQLNAHSGAHDFGVIPNHSHYHTLRYTLATLLALPLDVHWDPLRSYQLKALRKLVVNACINPLTAILDCKNGRLVGDPHAERTWSLVCHEASEIFLAAALAARPESSQQGALWPSYGARPSYDSATSADRARGATPPSIMPWEHIVHRPLSSYLPMDQSGEGASTGPVLDESLTPPSLFRMVRDVAVGTKHNFSSMHADVRGTAGNRHPRGRTEIEFLNGYLIELGKQYGVDARTNESLVNLVKSLCWGSQGQRYDWSKAPLADGALAGSAGDDTSRSVERHPER